MSFLFWFFSGELVLNPTAYQQLIEKAATQAPGVQVYIRLNNETWTSHAGFATLEDKTEMESSTPIRLASITKMFTTALIFELNDQGKLELSQTLETFFDHKMLEDNHLNPSVSIEELLRHTSGFPNFSEDHSGFYDHLWREGGYKKMTPVNTLSFVKGIDAKARGEFHYSNTNYVLLGLIIEAVEGKSFAEALDQHIINPFQLKNTFMEGSPHARPIASSYDIAEKDDIGREFGLFAHRKPVRDELYNLSSGREQSFNHWAFSAGALASNAQDLGSLLDTALYQNQLQFMFDQAPFLEGEPDQYGWTGGSWGISTLLWTSPGNKLTVCVLVNCTASVYDPVNLFKELIQASRTKD